MAAVPKDPIMLMSFLNTQLRDHYESLDELCMVYDLDKAEISSKLDVIDYHYNPEKNRFI